MSLDELLFESPKRKTNADEMLMATALENKEKAKAQNKKKLNDVVAVH